MTAPNHAWALLVLQVVAHVALISMLFWAPWYCWLITFVGYFVFSCVGASVAYHRLFGHRSFQAPVWFENMCVHVGNMSGLGSSISWVAIHRAHHRHTDQNNQDPHSPHHHAWYRVIWFSMFEPAHVKYVKDLVRNPVHLWWHNNYFWVHITVGVVGMIVAPAVYTSLILAPQALSWSMGGALNYVNHVWGDQPHTTTDRSTNHWFFGILYWGEGWHNNHHADPKRYQFGQQWWQWDMGAKIIDWVKKD